MSDPAMPFIWMALTLACLLFMQRWIHSHLHGVSLLLTGRPELAVIVYAVVLFPGVVLHETSHWLAATLLGVRTGSWSLLPKLQPDGTLQLGYVEYYKRRTLDPVRESLIGAAPLIAGTGVILLIGHYVFSVTSLADAIRTADVNVLADAMAQVLAAPNVLAWLYLIFAVSNAMLPSRSDRRAWPGFLVVMLVLTFVVAFLGRGTSLLGDLSRPVAVMFGYLATAFSIAIAVDIVFIAVIALAEWMLGRARGKSVIYGRQQSEEGTT
jgi:hypothetical protein